MQTTLTPAEQHLCDSLRPALFEVETHPVFARVHNLAHLRIFMEHHVFAVWDFMSLLKFLQNTLAPSTWPWLPRPHGNLVRLINEIVVGEECDLLPGPSAGGAPASYASHFDLYLLAMKEVGADTRPISIFIERVQQEGLMTALSDRVVPEASCAFMKETFRLLETHQPHRIAAAFAFGRENVIPGMFHSLLKKLGISRSEAPIFYYYLQRHAELDGDEHGPAALRLVATLCGEDASGIEEALASAKGALESRKQLWNDVLRLLEKPRSSTI